MGRSGAGDAVKTRVDALGVSGTQTAPGGGSVPSASALSTAEQSLAASSLHLPAGGLMDGWVGSPPSLLRHPGHC